MFKITIQKVDSAKLSRLQLISTDSLFEAEQVALKIVAKYFNNTDVMLVHRGNLEYDIYEIFEPIGSVIIKIE